MAKCKYCIAQYTKRNFSQPCCLNPECVSKWYSEDSAKKKIKAQTKKRQNEEKAFLKKKIKTLGQYEAEAKKSFQKWIRMRDYGKPCISCGSNEKDLVDGGHFFKAELFSGLIFDERNCHLQCRKCNRYLNGNELQYRKGLVTRYGLEYVEKLESESDSKRIYKFTKNELIAKKLQYDIKIKEFKNA